MKMEGYEKTYAIEQEQWFNDLKINGKLVHQVKKPTIGIHLSNCNEKGVLFEFSIVWEQIIDEIVISLHMYDDSWIAFKEMPEIFEMMSDIQKQKLQPDIHEFAKMLDKLGFRDITERKK